MGCGASQDRVRSPSDARRAAEKYADVGYLEYETSEGLPVVQSFASLSKDLRPVLTRGSQPHQWEWNLPHITYRRHLTFQSETADDHGLRFRLHLRFLSRAEYQLSVIPVDPDKAPPYYVAASLVTSGLIAIQPWVESTYQTGRGRLNSLKNRLNPIPDVMPRAGSQRQSLSVTPHPSTLDNSDDTRVWHLQDRRFLTCHRPTSGSVTPTSSRSSDEENPSAESSPRSKQRRSIHFTSNSLPMITLPRKSLTTASHQNLHSTSLPLVPMPSNPALASPPPPHRVKPAWMQKTDRKASWLINEWQAEVRAELSRLFYETTFSMRVMVEFEC